MTIHELAKELGISATTVSSALTGNGRISEHTRRRVLEAAAEAGFLPNPHARRFRWQKSNDTICLLSLGLASGVVVERISSLQRHLAQQGFNSPIHSMGWVEEKNLVDDMRLMREICLQRPRAIICNVFSFSHKAMCILEQYQDEGGIVVCYDHFMPEFDCVVFDEEHNTYTITTHLLELGHRSVLFSHLGSRSPQDPRRRGYMRALKEHGIKPPAEWFFSKANFGVAGGKDVMKAYLALPQKTTAVCIVNDDTAAAFIGEMQQRGYNIPRDVSVVGHDDSPLAPYAPVPLTTISHPVDDIVHEILQLLDDRLSNSAPSAPQHRIVRGKSAIRQSSAPPPGA
jgi:LacI family transcriptional regulator